MEPTEILTESLDSGAIKLVILVVQLAYGVPSFMLMVSFLVALRKFPNSFYRLVQLDLLVNILCYLNSWIAVRFRLYPFGIICLTRIATLFPWLLAVCSELVPFFFHLQFCSAISLSIHRISSVLFYTGYNKFWSKYYLIVGVCFVLYSACYWLIGDENNSSFHVENGTLVQINNSARQTSSFYTTAIASIVYMFLLMIVGIAAILVVKRSVKTINIEANRVSQKLTLIALTYCAIFSGILMWVLVGVLSINGPISFLPEVLYEYNAEWMAFSSDTMTLALPYILLAFDSNVRREVFRRSAVVSLPYVATDSR